MSKANVSSVSICAEQSSRPIDPSQRYWWKFWSKCSEPRDFIEFESLKNENFTSFTEQYQEADVAIASRPIDEHVENPENVDIQADIDSLIHSGGQVDRVSVEITNDNANEAEVLQYEQQLDLNVDVKGPAISEKIGGFVNKCDCKE
jgi:hypothetical protein